ncbi:MAG: PEP-CTERM sorting domain-containing protein [Terriglobales bacterium]
MQRNSALRRSLKDKRHAPRASAERQRARSLEPKWAAYTLAAGTLLALPVIARANSIVYTPSINKTIAETSHGPSQSTSVNFSLDNGAADFALSVNATYSTSSIGEATLALIAGPGAGAEAYLANSATHGLILESGDAIGSGNEFLGGNVILADKACNSYSPCGSINYNGTYLGVDFTRGGDTYYGWAKFNLLVEILDHSVLASMELLSYAYNDVPGADLTAGTAFNSTDSPSTVPEPSTLALLALGAVGLLAFRKHLGAASA